jgi:hypothetical protein
MPHTRKAIPETTIRWVVNRMHAAESNTQVIRNLRPRMEDAKGWTRARRKEAYRFALKVHAANRAIWLRYR